LTLGIFDWLQPLYSFKSQAIPSLEGFQRFSFDPEEASRFEIANELWSMMEGTTA
jgi:hypothetical protein